MTDEEYLEFLSAIYRKYVRVWKSIHHPEGLSHLHHEIERLASMSRFAQVVAERTEHIELYGALGAEIKYTYLSHTLEESGVLRALDAHYEEVFGGLRRSAIPDVDLEYLQLAGFTDPEAEIVLIIRYAKDRLSRSQQLPSGIVSMAHQELKRIGSDLESSAKEGEPKRPRPEKPRKLFTGVSKVLAGGVTAAGNLLLGVGAIAGAGPATTHAVIGSCALAVAAIGQGIGDLRGE